MQEAPAGGGREARAGNQCLHDIGACFEDSCGDKKTMSVNIPKHWIVFFKWVNYVVFELYLKLL